MKTYLVTGGAGFIGSNFVHFILDKHSDATVVNVDLLTYAGNLSNLTDLESNPRHIFVRADIRDKATMAQLIEIHDPDYIVNFAAESHVDRSILDPEVFASTNVMGTVALLNAAKEAWILPDESFNADKRFLQVSTDEVYGSLPLDQPDLLFTEDTPLSPRSPYSSSKAAADLIVAAYGSTYGMPVNITRCSNNYGPFQFPEKLIPLMISNAISHTPLPVYGDGLNVRDWLYVEDHCNAIDLVLRNGAPGEVYNIGGHNERANIYIVRKIIEECRAALNDGAIDDTLIEYVTDRKGHDRRYGIAPDKIGRDLGWKPETSFEEGIMRTIEWYLGHRDWMEEVRVGSIGVKATIRSH